MSARKAFSGDSRKLVLAFDVGTTFSGISYSILDPGRSPEIRGVTRFPGQHESYNGSSKIPTIIYYDKNGKVRAVGAEAVTESMLVAAEEECWFKAEWFKLLLCKKKTGNPLVQEISLPPRKTITQVFADFLKYLFECASEYIKDTHANGPDLWASVKDKVDFVLSHPNGWEGREQAIMRNAAILAGLVPDTPVGRGRVSFLTEGEASLHFAIENGLLEGVAEKGQGFLIVDAGGGTIDTSVYRRKPGDSKSFEEIAASQCHLNGSVFVSRRARQYLKGWLTDSPFEDDVDTIVDEFDRATKQRFSDPKNPQFIKVGNTRQNFKEWNISHGQLKLDGKNVLSFFAPSLRSIVNSIGEQRRLSVSPIKHVILVGGFSANEWLFKSLNDNLAPHRMNVFRPPNRVNKAVADGALSFYLDHYVTSRVSKYTFGTDVSVDYNSFNEEHVKRRGKVFRHSISGELRVPGGFAVILPKNTQVTESKEFRQSFILQPVFSPGQSQGVEQIDADIFCYHGIDKNPGWMDTDRGNFARLCNIVADRPQMSRKTKTNGDQNKIYSEVSYEIVILFGKTELQAQIAWLENGVEKRSPAKIVYNDEDF
ncbi:unnamed protein product [Cyclocybe aegerita]|uniref:Uncharacterized protein n=1 Tax=Cyclocybe aegerita TaxID=1973307 RepID=A0A8S0VX84_CYCAE|nr:unnamed protein product [Cyclocybe aegerita]